MSHDPLKNWQLEKSDEPLEQWKLQDSEQAAAHLQLQETGATPANWQPVEYQRAAARSGRNWILPSIVIVALLAALAYVAYISLNNLGISLPTGFGLSGAPTIAPTPNQAVAAMPTETPTEEPTPTPEPPTPTPEPPTPTPAVILTRIGVVNDPAGVNARREPSTTAAIIRLLNSGERVTIVRQEGDWLLVILPENQAAWVWAEYFDQSVGEEMTLEEWNAILTAAGLPPVTPEAGVEPTPPAQTAATTLSATVIADPGATLRIEPALQAQVVGEALLGAALTVSGRTDAGDWLLATLPDGRRGWISAGLVSVAGDVAILPVQPSDSLVAVGIATPTPVASAPETPTGAPPFTLEINNVIPPAPYTNTIPTVGQAIAISDTAGVRARTAPSLEAAIVTVLPNGAVLPAVGRSPDTQWVQVVLPDNQRAWVFRGVVIVSSNIDDAPIVGADGQPVEPTPSPGTPAEPTLTVKSLLGANIRSAPSNESEPIETVSMGATFPAVGRTEDGSWIQVRLADGTTGWVLASTSELNVDVTTLPVVP
ncbi:MAG: SH3 domain-containing protein [Caldilinea sp.]|nr:SH3 domain-containing protein [Caldilinea sp.]MDW8438937.1 SH3 domain-containing protein [Caldilineaceae bacterium]